MFLSVESLDSTFCSAFDLLGSTFCMPLDTGASESRQKRSKHHADLRLEVVNQNLWVSGGVWSQGWSGGVWSHGMTFCMQLCMQLCMFSRAPGLLSCASDSLVNFFRIVALRASQFLHALNILLFVSADAPALTNYCTGGSKQKDSLECFKRLPRLFSSANDVFIDQE